MFVLEIGDFYVPSPQCQHQDAVQCLWHKHKLYWSNTFTASVVLVGHKQFLGTQQMTWWKRGETALVDIHQHVFSAPKTLAALVSKTGSGLWKPKQSAKREFSCGLSSYSEKRPESRTGRRKSKTVVPHSCCLAL